MSKVLAIACCTLIVIKNAWKVLSACQVLKKLHLNCSVETLKVSLTSILRYSATKILENPLLQFFTSCLGIYTSFIKGYTPCI